MKRGRFRREVVVSIPETLQPNVLYVTVEGDIAGHLCACGCGREVITPLSPTDWSMHVDQRGVSLSPSIGNWTLPCRSHYYIWEGAVVWAGDMSERAIAAGRRRDRARKQRYYSPNRSSTSERAEGRKEPEPAVLLEQRERPSPAQPVRDVGLLGWWRRLWRE